MNLERTVRSVTRRLTVIRAAETSVRWCFVASVAVFMGLVGATFGFWILPTAAAAALVAAGAAAGALAGVLGAPDAAATARRLDRILGLEDRVATALEARGLFAELQRADALRALSAADRRRATRFVLSTEGRLLPVIFALCAGALMAQGGRRNEESQTPEPTAAHLEALRWLATAVDQKAGGDDLQQKLAALTPKITANPIQELRAIAQEAQARLEAGGITGAQAERLRQIGRAARGAAAALGRDGGGTPWDLAGVADPALEEAFGDGAQDRTGSARGGKGVASPASSGAPLPPRLVEMIRKAPRTWSHSYDSIVRRYFQE